MMRKNPFRTKLTCMAPSMQVYKLVGAWRSQVRKKAIVNISAGEMQTHKGKMDFLYVQQ